MVFSKGVLSLVSVWMPVAIYPAPFRREFRDDRSRSASTYHSALVVFLPLAALARHLAARLAKRSHSRKRGSVENRLRSHLRERHFWVADKQEVVFCGWLR